MLRSFIAIALASISTFALFYALASMLPHPTKERPSYAKQPLVQEVSPYSSEPEDSLDGSDDMLPSMRAYEVPLMEAIAKPAIYVPKLGSVEPPSPKGSFTPSIATLSSFQAPTLSPPTLKQEDRELLVAYKIAPLYPPRAKRMGIEGYVKIKVWVNKEGEVRKFMVLEASPKGVFEKSVKQAVMQWRFSPKYEGSQPIEQVGVMRLDFKLE